MTAEYVRQLQQALGSRYMIERELCRGATTVVFVARDCKHHRSVALKVLRPELVSAIGSERFLEEIQFAATLQHPHILPVYDSDHAAGFLYYVTPYVKGRSLRERLNRARRLTLNEALQITDEVAHALDHAHANGVVHRDIKPENILLEDGYALVADFGLACAMVVAGEGPVTPTGIAVGTPAYMSPEQSAGSDQLDGRSDTYSLGCVLYEMLAGQPPFTGGSGRSVCHDHEVSPPPPLRNFRPMIPVEVVLAMERALAKSPNDRFATAMAFAGALQSVGNRMLAAHAKVIKLLTSDAPLHRLLGGVCRWVEVNLPDMMCCVLLLDETEHRLRYAAAPRLPARYCRATDGLPVDAATSPCGAAIFHGRQVIVSDVTADPRWRGFGDVLLPFGLRACWSTPIRSERQQVIGAVGLYSHEPRDPTPEDRELARYAAALAWTAIDRDRRRAERERADAARDRELRASWWL